MSRTPEYNVWASMKKRCLKPGHKAYSHYGGRGITVCERWLKFRGFIEDMGPRPTSEHSLDRFPDPKGNYEPANCRWATWEEQNRNRDEYNVIVPFNGQMITVGEWAKITGGNPIMVYNRLKAGWKPEDAISIAKRSTLGERHVGMKRTPQARANMAAAQRRRRQRDNRLSPRDLAILGGDPSL